MYVGFFKQSSGRAKMGKRKTDVLGPLFEMLGDMASQSENTLLQPSGKMARGLSYQNCPSFHRLVVLMKCHSSASYQAACSSTFLKFLSNSPLR